MTYSYRGLTCSVTHAYRKLTETRAHSCGEMTASRGSRAESETSSMSGHAEAMIEAYRQVTTAHGGMTETLPDSYRQMPSSLGNACGCISQTTPEALGEMASSHAGSLSDRPEAFACSLCESTEPSIHT